MRTYIIKLRNREDSKDIFVVLAICEKDALYALWEAGYLFFLSEAEVTDSEDTAKCVTNKATIVLEAFSKETFIE